HAPPANVGGNGRTAAAASVSSLETQEAAGTVPARCAHCGEPCPCDAPLRESRRFCCAGCETVFALLTDSGLGQFYELADRPGKKMGSPPAPSQWAFLDQESVRSKLVDFSDGRQASVRFLLPSIHCVACVWLLENL